MSSTEIGFHIEVDPVLSTYLSKAVQKLEETRYCSDNSTPYHPWQACYETVNEIIQDVNIDIFTLAKAFEFDTTFSPTHSSNFFVKLNERAKNGKKFGWHELQVYLVTGILYTELEAEHPQLFTEREQIYNEHMAWREREERLLRTLTGK